METLEPPYSSLSELESLSDSDWLDLSSRASEDNDSVNGFDDYSDREGIDRPSSRRSFVSFASSRSGAVDAWEGIIEDSSDEGDAILAGSDPLNNSLESPDDAIRDTAHSSDIKEDPDDERVKAGLEQSMMSTLSSSRSNSLSASMQTSVVRSTKDLRLSFPDPLTSSHNQSNNTSFEDISHNSLGLPPIATDATNDDDDDAQSLADDDPGSNPTPEVSLQTVKYSDVPSAISPDFCVVLYGSSSLTKFDVVNRLLENWASATGLILSCNLTHAPGVTTQVFVPQDHQSVVGSSNRYVSVIDRTGVDSFEESTDQSRMSCASLAVVFLPAAITSALPEHTLYLPVVIPPVDAISDAVYTDYFLDAEQEWETFGIPSQKLASFGHWTAPIVDQEYLARTTPGQVHVALRPLFTRNHPVTARATIGSRTVVLAVLSILLGYVVHGSFNIPTPIVPPRPSSALWGLLRTQVFPANRTTPSIVSSFPVTDVPIAASSWKGYEVAVLRPNSLMPIASTSSLTSHSGSSSGTEHVNGGAEAPTECSCGCGLVTLPGKTDLAVRPVASVPAITTHPGKGLAAYVSSSRQFFSGTGTKGEGKGKEKASEVEDTPTQDDSSLHALSTRFATSVSQYFGTYDFYRVLAKAINKDLQELLDALDRLAFAIRRETKVIMGTSRDAARLVKQEVRQRHLRAKRKARNLRLSGERFFSSVGEQIIGRVGIARENARALWETDVKGFVQHRAEVLRAKRLRRRERREQRRASRRAAAAL
ncbi:hypothetical protein K474DRAFT_1771444 [Panus rudis PR-1116 ss-1]|nr:hypothetical protein K474DRAFT_1771444 [Panus rudis PR-1116 ss-1]